MNQVLQHSRHSLASRIFSAFLIFTFSLGVIIPPYVAEAQVIPVLPIPGAMVMQTPGYVPALIKGITIHPENPLAFDFIIDTGDSGIEVESQAFKDESIRLVKYFMASLTVPEDEMWVNLSPVEKDRIVPQSFGMTDMGMDLLAQDYILKQLTASLMYPEEELGKKFWDRVYERAQKEYGTTDIPMSSFHKVWILPKDALVYEKGNQAFVIRNELKVMMEEDYFALQNSRTLGHQDTTTPEDNKLTKLQTEIMKEIILPEIEKEVNEGKNFAQLRQIFQSAILATWFKQNLKQSLLGQVYVDQKKTKGIDIDNPQVKEDIYQQYLKAFEKGVYDYIREDYDPTTQELIPRHYFSGGTAVTPSLTTKTVKHNELSDSMKEVIRKFIEDYEGGKLVNTEVNLAENPAEAENKKVEVKKDEAMLTEEAADKIVSELVSYNITAPSQQMEGEIMGKIRTLSRYLGELKANSDINSLNIAERLKNNESLMTFLSNFAEVSSRDVDERLSPKKDIYLFIVNIESLANLKNLTEQDSLYVGMSQEARKLAEPLIQSAVLSWNKYEGYVNQHFHVIHFTAQVLFKTGLVPTLEQAKQMVETVFTSAYRFEQESWHYQAVKAMVSTSPFDQVVPDTTLKQFADSSTKELPEFFERILDEWLEDTRNTGWSVEDTSHALYEEAKIAQEEGIVDPEMMRGVYKRDIVAILQVLKRVEVLEGPAVGDSAMLTNVPTFIQQMDMWKIMRTKGAQNMLAEFANWTYETLIAKNENVPQLLDGTEDAETRNKKIGPNLAPFDAIESGLTIISNRNEKDRMEDLAKIPERELTQEKLDEINKRYPTRLMDILENLIVQMKDMKEGGQAHQDLILLAEMANATWKARQTSERRIERDVFRPWSLLSKEQIDKDFIFLDQFLPKVLEMLKQMRSEAYSPEVRKQFQQQINVMVDKAAEVMKKKGEKFNAQSLDAIRKTALGVMEMFSEKTRKDGVTPYFTHQLGMAMLALDTFDFNDTVGSLIALLHHDTREDLPDMYDAYKNYIRGKIMLESDAVARDKRIAQVDSFLLEVKLLSKLDGDSDDVELIKKYFQQMEDPTNPAFNFAPREGQDWYTADFIHDIQAIKLIDILFNIGDLFNVFKDANLEAMNERTKGLPERSYKKLFIGIENLVIPSKFLSKGEKLKFLDGVIATIKGYTTAEEFKKAEYAPLIEASSQEVLDQLADYRNVVDQMVTEGTSAEQKDVSIQPTRSFRKGAKFLSFDEFVRLGGLQAYSQGVTLIEVIPDGKGYFGIRVSGSAWLKELIDSGLVWVEQSKMASGRYTMDVYYEQNNAEKIQAVLNDLEARQFPREISIDLPRITSENPLDLGRGQTLHSTEGMSPESKSALFERLKVLYNRNSDGYGVGYLNLSYHKNAEALYITENNEIAGFIVFELERGLGQRWNLTLQVTNYGNEGKGIGTKLALYMILTIKQRFPEAKITSTELTGSKRDLSKPVDTTDRQGTGYGLWKGLEEKTGYKFVVEKTDKSEPHVDGFLSSEDMREIDNIRAGNIKVSYLEFVPPSLFVIKTWIDKFVGDQAMLTDDGDGDFFKDLDPRIKEFFVSHGVLTLADFQAKWQELFEYLLKMSDQDGTREMIKVSGNILKQHDGLPAFDLLLEKDPSWNLLMNGKTLKLATEFVGLDDIVAVSTGDNTEARLSYHFKEKDLSQTIFIDSVNKQIEAQFIAHMSPEENSGLRDFREVIKVFPQNIQISVTNLPLQIISEEKLLKGIRFTRENGIELLLSENAKELSRAVQIALLDGAPPIQVAMDFKKLVIDHARQVMAKQYGVDERQLIGDLPALLTNFLRLNLSAMEIKPEAIVESWAFGIMLQAIDLALTIKDPKDSTKNMFTRADFAGINFDKIIRGAVEKDGQAVKSVDTVKLARPAEMVFLIVENGLKGTLDRGGVSSSEQIKQLSRAMSMMGAAHISALVSHFFYGFKMVNSAVIAISGKIAALRKSKTSFSSDAVRSDGATSSPDKRSGDHAMLTEKGDVGGIDLNPEFLDLKIKRDGAGIPLPMIQQSIETMMQIEGFLPVIINVTPIQSLPMLLGMDVEPEGEDSGNRLSQLDAMDKVAKLD